MMSTMDKIINILVLDDKFGKINSHWAFSTEKLIVIDRIYYDDILFEEKVLNLINEVSIDAIGFSGRNAIEAELKLEKYLRNKSLNAYIVYKKIKKIMKIHNTNLSYKINAKELKIGEIKEKGNDWVKIALENPFDCVFVQTYGDAEIINDYTKNNKAVWVPYTYNDLLFYDRKSEKTVDIGAYFKIERHIHRIDFIKRLERFAQTNNYSFDFSDQYWGEEYAKKISQANVVVHLSYCGDIPWRLYECAASRTCFFTDSLRFNIRRLFSENCYEEYNRNYSNFEEKLNYLLLNSEYRNRIVENAQREVKKYAWSTYADNYIVPIIKKL